MINEVAVYIQKIKYKHLGQQGVIELNYDYENGRFNPGAGCDKSNWLISEPISAVIEANINFYEKNESEPPF
jgi:hypothetical protein